MANVLILTKPDDIHAVPVIAVLRELGHFVQVFNFAGFPWEDRHELLVGDRPLEMSSTAMNFNSDGPKFDSVWFRRLAASDVRYEDIDPLEHRFVGETHAYYRSALYTGFSQVFSRSRDAFWVNPYEAGITAENKILQLHLAHLCGLRVPKTLITNDPAAVARFTESVDGNCICKGFVPAMDWLDTKGRQFANYTAVLPNLREIAEESIRVVPAIYQPKIEKQYELRVTFIGEKHFACKIDSQANSATSVDLRILINTTKSPYQIPDELATRCQKLMAALNIRFACFDFIREPNGEYTFLELNQAGQFLFIELACPTIPLLDAMCHFLAHRTMEAWSPSKAKIFAGDVYERPEVRDECAEIVQKIGQDVMERNRHLYPA